MKPTMAKISVENLYKEYGSGSRAEVAVAGVNLQIEDGEFVSLVGPSGCGKTTTLRCIAGLETPTRGEIRINGRNVENKPPQERNLAMVFQKVALYPHMSVRDNISYPLRLQKVPKAERTEKIRNATEILQIEQHLDKNVGQLSGGQSQRVALARAIVRDPDAFLLDEPMSDLDAQLKIEMRKELGKIQNKLDNTMVYVTHDQEEAMTLSDRMAVMNDGQIVDVGTPHEVFQNPSNTFVARFIGSPSINFLDSSVVKDSDNTVTLNVEGNVHLTFQHEAQGSGRLKKLPDELILGFRPRRAEITPPSDSALTGRIELNESIGDEVIQYLEGPSGELRVVTPVESTDDEGQEVGLRIQNSGIHLFDKDNGEKILSGAKSGGWATLSPA